MSAVGIAVAIDAIDLEERFVTRITDRWWKIHRDIVAIGKDLYEAQQSLPYGQFDRMIRMKLPFIHRSTAYNYVNHYLFTISDEENVQSIRQLDAPYSISNILMLVEKSHPGAYSRGIKDGRVFPGMSQREALEWKQDVASAHEHAPVATRSIGQAKRPAGAGATCYEELLFLAVEWRKSKGLSQIAVDGLIEWAEGYTSKVEIPHTTDGKRLTMVPSPDSARGTLWDLLHALGLGIQLVPLA
jgi:hypothetical protein